MASKSVPGVSLSIKMGISNPNLFIKSVFASTPNWSPTFLSSKIPNAYLGVTYEDDSCAIHSLDQAQQVVYFILLTILRKVFTYLEQSTLVCLHQLQTVRQFKLQYQFNPLQIPQFSFELINFLATIGQFYRMNCLP